MSIDRTSRAGVDDRLLAAAAIAGAERPQSQPPGQRALARDPRRAHVPSHAADQLGRGWHVLAVSDRCLDVAQDLVAQGGRDQGAEVGAFLSGEQEAWPLATLWGSQIVLATVPGIRGPQPPPQRLPFNDSPPLREAAFGGNCLA